MPVSYTHLDVYKRQEWAFFNVGTLEDARQKAAEKMAEEKGGAV